MQTSDSLSIMLLKEFDLCQVFIFVV